MGSANQKVVPSLGGKGERGSLNLQTGLPSPSFPTSILLVPAEITLNTLNHNAEHAMFLIKSLHWLLISYQIQITFPGMLKLSQNDPKMLF